MMRRITGIGVLAVALTMAVHHPTYGRLVSSATEFRNRYRDLKTDNQLSPLERVIVSLMLSAKGTEALRRPS
jgi:hypothetical protein